MAHEALAGLLVQVEWDLINVVPLVGLVHPECIHGHWDGGIRCDRFLGRSVYDGLETAPVPTEALQSLKWPLLQLPLQAAR